jgi:predicted enzyme related to lactoylglutathione lyase
MIKRIKFMGVPVADQDRALRFYTEKLGLTVVTDQPMGPGMRWIELGIPGAQTGITLFTPEGHEDRVGGFVNASFSVDDIDATYRELLSREVEILGPPEKEPWGSFVKVKDSEGNVLLLSQAR